MLGFTTKNNIQDEIYEKGYTIVVADDIPIVHTLSDAWEELRADYDSLPPDEYLPNNASYRFRRYDSFTFNPQTGALSLRPHEDYFQSTDINAVTGGIIRRFAPLRDETLDNPFLQALIRWDFEQFPLHGADHADRMWRVDVHEILVVAEPNSTAHPTPEGVHRDGAEFVTVHLAVLENADGGLVTVYDDDKNPLESFQLKGIMDSYLFDDARLWHGVTPIVSRDGTRPARRAILTFDYHLA